MLRGKNLLKISDYSTKELQTILGLAHKLKQRHLHGDGLVDFSPLAKKSCAMIFQKRSTRTRVSTETGLNLLGGHGLFLSSDDVQLGVNETVKDSALVLSGFNNFILARVFGHAVVEVWFSFVYSIIYVFSLHPYLLILYTRTGTMRTCHCACDQRLVRHAPPSTRIGRPHDLARAL